ncbi:hypothetical protein [Neisseria shayeganii]|uniref:Uncharacterized protein n=1 Tax=Neisseria shayeganii TaxID=607712 RepID=A0A7D7N6H4_9NEIS|nr:hypothetical protein [Neisseria shayeganii]QMT41300.1 hypothetical protein H3L94_04550 [Neisseria shayeganii]
MAKRAFLTNIGKKPLKALYAKDYSGFYQPKCPLSLKQVAKQRSLAAQRAAPRPPFSHQTSIDKVLFKNLNSSSIYAQKK